jgi:hypothetical protein
LSKAFPDVEVTHSVRRVIDFDPTKYYYPTNQPPQNYSADDADCAGGGLSLKVASQKGAKPTVYNILNTSYPCDILDPVTKLEWAESADEKVFYMRKKNKEEEANFTADPEVRHVTLTLT